MIKMLEMCQSAQKSVQRTKLGFDPSPGPCSPGRWLHQMFLGEIYFLYPFDMKINYDLSKSYV
jgi:hypothetical protein